MFNLNDCQRILLKVTGESLMKEGNAFSSDSIHYLVDQISTILSYNKQLCIVVGGGNLYRGVQGSVKGITSEESDYIGMLATAMNVLALSSFLRNSGVGNTAYSAFSIHGIIDEFQIHKVIKDLNDNKVVLLCGGLGQPFFTTDTASVLRALQIKADVLLKATKVDGVYDKDPNLYKDAVKYKQLSYEKILQDKYHIMDQTAFTLAYENKMPMIIFDFFQQDHLKCLLNGEQRGTLIMRESELYE